MISINNKNIKILYKYNKYHKSIYINFFLNFKIIPG